MRINAGIRALSVVALSTTTAVLFGWQISAQTLPGSLPWELTELGGLLTDLSLLSPARVLTADDLVYVAPEPSGRHCDPYCAGPRDLPAPDVLFNAVPDVWSGPGAFLPFGFPSFGFPFPGVPSFGGPDSFPARLSDPLPATEQPSPVAVEGRFIVLFEDDATEDDVRELLRRYGLAIVPDESIPEERFFVLDLSSGPTSTASLTSVLLSDTVRALREEPIVRNAVPDLVTPSSQRATAVTRNGSISVWAWDQDQDDGNWGFKMHRIPAIWRVLAHPSMVATPSPRLAVVDIGFEPHADLTAADLEIQTIAGEPGNAGHGNATLGIIGARAGDDQGIEGILIRPVIVGVQTKVFQPGRDTAQEVGVSMTWMSAILNATYRMLKAYPDIRVVNLSLQYSWCRLYGGSDARLIEEAVAENGQLAGNLFEDFRDSVLFVSAAGNDNGCQTAAEQRALGPLVPASVSSPFNWLAIHDPRWQHSVLVVEAHNRAGLRATTPAGDVMFSNFGGTIAAPGQDVMSTGTGNGYLVTSGTSVAAPFVTGVAGALLTVRPDLTPGQLWRAIVETAAASTDRGPPLIDPLDAFLRIAPGALVLLCDVNGDGVLTDADLAGPDPRRNVPATASSPLDFNGDGRIADRDRPTRLLGELLTDGQVFERALAAAALAAATPPAAP
ncbi:MAG: S8 family serine peptidase [Bauldia sp.]|nr:S8 family serine peptidase [Bauldia sp.]